MIKLAYEKKLCPLLKGTCREDQCSWWAQSRCAVEGFGYFIVEIHSKTGALLELIEDIDRDIIGLKEAIGALKTSIEDMQ